MKHISRHRVALSEYIRSERHLLKPGRAKTIKQIACETGMSMRTARRWARIDHHDEWLRWWPTFDDIIAEVFGDHIGAPSKPPLALGDIEASDFDNNRRP